MSRIFAPATDAITASAAASINSLTEFSMLAWVKVSNFPALNDFGNILNKVNPADGITGKALYINNVDLGSGAKNYLSAFFSANGETNAAASSADLSAYPSGWWIHVAATYSQTGNKTALLYINGHAVSSYDFLQPGTANLDADAAYSFHAGTVGAFGPIDGKLFDCRYYNTPLTEDEIYQIVRRGYIYDPQPTHLKLQWALASSGTTETDLSSNSNTGTFTGTTFSQDNPMKLVSNAVTRAQNDLKGPTLVSTDYLDFANEIYQIMCTATLFDFRLASGTTFGTTANTQDYANVPSDFAALKQDGAYIQNDASATNRLIPLAVRETLPKSTSTGTPNAISVENGNFRLLPVPNVTRSGSGQWAVKFEYWKRPKQLTSSGDSFEFDDAWFPTFCKGFTARVAEFQDDERAGVWGGRNELGKFVGTGMWGEFAAALNTMVEQEGLASGPQVFAPTESIFKG